MSDRDPRNEEKRRRDERLAAALRANLKRRKMAARTGSTIASDASGAESNQDSNAGTGADSDKNPRLAAAPKLG
jgi:hypothetical protein